MFKLKLTSFSTSLTYHYDFNNIYGMAVAIINRGNNHRSFTKTNVINYVY